MSQQPTEVRATRFAEDLRISLRVRQHELVSDAAVNDGGTDLGPTPHELLAAALAACTSMTVQMYANRKKWPLKSADVTVLESKVAAVGEGEAKTNFNVTVSLDGPMSSEQRERLLEIAYRCPVHRALAGAIELNVSLV